jgi:GNAT superfamily N-acetyltransferase
MDVIRRAYADAEDYWRIRDFLRETYRLNDRRERCWSLLRWDYWRWHVHENIHQFNLGEAVRVWEADGQIAAVLNLDNPGEAFFQVHPAWEGAGLRAEMLEAAEAGLAARRPDGRRTLTVWVLADDAAMQTLVRRRGYAKAGPAEHMRRRTLCGPLPVAPAPAGYTVRALGGEEELPARSWLSWKAFHPNEPDEKYQGWEWYRNVQRVPLYRRDLDLVAVAPDGELAAFATVWLDDVNRMVVFEPVGTHPAHQRRGLGKAVMAEGQRRAARLGATLATVSSYGTGAHALYAAMGFTEFDLLEPWEREWSQG